MNSPVKWGAPRKDNFPDDNDDLIEVVNKLQNTLAASGQSLDISLPQIVVVGCQSAGKSSVLENVVGREFLPRGTGVVTRRPTVVQLQPFVGEEYAEFLHRPKEKFTDFEEVKDEILNETMRYPGPVGFSSRPISLKIYAPNVLKLTLVDLPGLIRIVIGDQAEECIGEVREMILQYIEQSNSIILAVTPANQDLANSDALEIAKTVDPEGVRTIGVLTKLDLMDHGTHAREILENKKIPLKRGYVGVLNRSQKDIEEGKSIQYCLEKEKKFFASMACYKHMADRMGSPYLQRILHQQLRAHIKESLPAVREELSQKRNFFKKEMKKIEEKIGYSSLGGRGVQFYMVKLVQEFIEELFVKILGYSEKVPMKEFTAGAILNYKLNKFLPENLKLPLLPKREELLKIIANMHGIRNCFTMPSLALEAINGHMVTQYFDPLDNFVEDIAKFLFLKIEESAETLNSYSNLRNELLFKIKSAVDSAANHTKDILKKHVEAEMYYVNIHHEDFKFPECTLEDTFQPLRLWNSPNCDRNPVASSSSGYGGSCNSLNDCDIIMEKNLVSNDCAKKNADFLLEMCETYLKIQKKQIGDTSIKYIIFFLVKRIMDFVKLELLPTIMESTNFDYLLEDCTKDYSRLTEMQTTCNCFEDAFHAIQNF